MDYLETRSYKGESDVRRSAAAFDFPRSNIQVVEEIASERRSSDRMANAQCEASVMAQSGIELLPNTRRRSCDQG
jgi:hypothetical protein